MPREEIHNRRRFPSDPKVMAGRALIRGFTLIELILVFFIIALVISMALPAMNEFKRDRDLKTASAITQQALNYARSLAVTTGRRTRLVPDPDRQGEFTLEVEDNPLTEPGSFDELNWPMGITGTLPETVRIKQIYYPVPDEEPQAEGETQPSDDTEFISEEEAMEERQAALLFEPDGSSRDTFIYLYLAGKGEKVVEPSEVDEEDVVTVAVIGAIGTSVLVPKYTEDIFDIYEPSEIE
ncbi:MAG: prepilin-type N-terminal cleavage/methylation domain-containing protein [Candidatus Omnitrophica bacterium]|nr:prepilin-type N-terminal cleavage/methylation domain-containing protein [Candidatus Omnitrophota bacterium]